MERLSKAKAKKKPKKVVAEFVPTNYPSDLSDAEWEQIRDFFPPGRNSSHDKRTLINGVLYLVDNGCKWRALPHDFPPYTTVFSFYYRAKKSGLWERVQLALVSKVRLRAGRNENPSYAILDSQSVKTVYRSEGTGIDGGKKPKDENGI